jgi:hypothetical protein
MKQASEFKKLLDIFLTENNFEKKSNPIKIKITNEREEVPSELSDISGKVVMIIGLNDEDKTTFEALVGYADLRDLVLLGIALEEANEKVLNMIVEKLKDAKKGEEE